MTGFQDGIQTFEDTITWLPPPYPAGIDINTSDVMFWTSSSYGDIPGTYTLQLSVSAIPDSTFKAPYYMVTWSQLITVHVVTNLRFFTFVSLIEANMPTSIDLPEQDGAIVAIDLSYVWDELYSDTVGYASYQMGYLAVDPQY